MTENHWKLCQVFALSYQKPFTRIVEFTHNLLEIASSGSYIRLPANPVFPLSLIGI